jgi:hypothetical protein
MGCLITPSVRIDAAICDLLAKIYSFSDSDFETEAIELEENEIESIVVKLIEEVTNNLTGKALGFYLQAIRQSEQGKENCCGSTYIERTDDEQT